MCRVYKNLEGNELPDIEERIAKLRYEGGEHFFDAARQEVFPESDFWLCIEYNHFPFVIQASEDDKGFLTKKIEV